MAEVVTAPQYFCPTCRGWYYKSDLRCPIAHPPGQCCHIFEPHALPLPLPEGTVLCDPSPSPAP